MLKKRIWIALAMVVVISVVAISGCQQATPEPTEVPEEPTEAPTEEPTEVPPTEPPAEPELGSEERPIQVYFVPSVEAETIVAGGEVLQEALEEATGLAFEVYVPTSYAAFVEGMCAAPADSMGFPATFAYVVANARCGVDASMRAVRYGDPFYYGQIIVARDSEFESIEDLDGASWAYTDPTSTSGFIVPTIMLAANDVEVSESVATGGHGQAALAIYNGEADFGTTYFNPPQPVEGADVEPWEYGDDPEPYADVVDECVVTEEGDVVCGNWEIKDARNRIVDTAPDVIQQVRILAISEQIPNDCLAFGPDFPPELREQIEQALMDLQGTETWEQSLGEVYNWGSAVATSDADYDGIRAQVEAGGLSMDDIVGVLEGGE